MTAQYIDDEQTPLFGGVFAIFGHGNVTCLGDALHEQRETLAVWCGHNEQAMGLAAAAFAKAHRRQRIYCGGTVGGCAIFIAKICGKRRWQRRAKMI